MADLSPLTYGSVRGRFVVGIADSADAGEVPDVAACAGTVTFTPSAAQVKVASAVPVPATLVPMPITVSLDSDGYLTQAADLTKKYVTLLATDDPADNPVGWQWKVTFALTYNGKTVPLQGFNFELPGGTTVDLTLLSPVVSSGGTPIVVGPPGPAGPGFLVLNPGQSVPVDTPIGTIIVRIA